MAGLLGTSMDDPRTMAVLSLAGGLLSGGNTGQAMQRGLLGYQQAMQAANQEKRQAAQDKMAQDEFAMRQRAFQMQEAKMQQEQDAMQQRRQHLLTLQNALKTGEVTGNELLQAGIPADLIKEALSVRDMGRPEVARTAEVEGEGGQKMIASFDKFGRPIGTPVAGYTAPVTVNLGDKIGFAKPIAGQSFNVGMSPDARASNAVAWANNAVAQQQAGIAQQRLGIDLMQAKQKMMGDLPQGYMWSANGQASPIPGTEQAQKADIARREKQASIESGMQALRLVDQAIQHPGRTTATGFSSLIDPRNYIPGTEAKDFQAIKDQIAGGAFLQAFESLKGGGAITEVEGKKAELAIARMQTSQSDKAFEAALTDYRNVIEGGLRRMGANTPNGKPATGSPMLGQVVDGYKFKGGNPADPRAWEKQ